VPELSYFDMFYDFGSTFELNTSLTDTFVDYTYRFYLSTNTNPERLSENDTILHHQTFQNYYSYDDGSAEAAYGLIGNGVELAYRFSILDGIGTDTLKSIKIHFSPSVNDASNDPFFLQIWDDSLGSPGSLIYTTDDFDFPELYYPEYNSGLNGFFEYELPSLVPVSDTFYIGWKQTSSSRLNIGFDKNIDRKLDIFYNLGSGFQNTIFDGALMMRPVFVSPMDNVVNYPELLSKEENISFYPNPADDLVLISNKDVESIEIYDLNGRMVNSLSMDHENSIMVKNLLNGIYFIKFKLKNGEIKVEKLIVQHH
jgi:hypothetical protein